MSYKEKSVWVSLILNLAIAGYYIFHLHGLYQADLLTEETLTGLFVKIVLMLIVWEIILQASLALLNYHESDKGEDERESLFKLRGNRNGYHVLTAVVFMAIFILWKVDFSEHRLVFNELSAAMNTLNILVMGVLVAEIVNYASQVFYFRRGY
ncbi:hypothetical protein [Thalassotalea litorea]|uniref:hypothetical protein n=1 Tax=Thalassotalea litorea TaxID=2020715 RepID=UPI003736CE5A